MKGYFIPFGARSIVSLNKKIDLQISELSKISDVYEADVKLELSDKWKVLKTIITQGALPIEYSELIDTIEDPDYLFIRHSGADRYYIRFLETIKRRFPQCKIVVELATYPYIKEMSKEKVNWPLFPSILHFQKKLYKYVDRFLVYTDKYDNILNVPIISTINGIRVDDITPYDKQHSDCICLIGVAYMQPYTGYDRLIKSLAHYYSHGGNRDVVIYLVGEGIEEKKYRKLVEQLKMGDRVILCGKQTGKELDNIYRNAHIGIEVLGMYRRDVSIVSSSLKTREYLAYGLPIIGACKVDVFEKYKFPYYLEFPNDASPIDFNQIIDFYDRVYGGSEQCEVSKLIHQYALDYVDISKTMSPLLEYLKSNCD